MATTIHELMEKIQELTKLLDGGCITGIVERTPETEELEDFVMKAAELASDLNGQIINIILDDEIILTRKTQLLPGVLEAAEL